MINRILVSSALAALLVGSSAFAAPPATAPATPTTPATSTSTDATSTPDMRRHGKRGEHQNRHDKRGEHDAAWKNASAEERAALTTLQRLERVYMRHGRGDELRALYTDVLGKTTNTLLTERANRGLQRLQDKPAMPEEQVDTLKARLDSELGKL